ncbi:class I SAM-dependent DNA methyltransferase [Niastella sp. OAS944]|uniref:HsdM family class I SAM-dependent methyltransferase n=1 Tax=Niastella sp. OAS944 TaxID=2664089 RepID=UPI00348489FA|nr:type I restriction-modification system DNA methylase subunit [Chitinophagaceae bacterium OAS944]
MTIANFYKDFGFTEAYDLQEEDISQDLEDFRLLGVDKIYFSGDYPAIFFKEIAQFDYNTLKEIAQVQHLAWNYRKVMFLIAVSPTEIRIYNCCKKPFNYDKPGIDIQEQTAKLELIGASQRDKKAMETIKDLFSRIAVDSGLFWTSENELRKQVDIQQRIDKYLVQSLLTAAKELKRFDLNDNFIHSLLMRSIFIMYLEDKGAAKETKLYSQISKGAQSYLDILQNKSDTYTLFKKVEEHFNGNVFPILKGEERQVTEQHLNIIKKCLTDGDLSHNLKLFEWRLFRFDLIQIELLSEIYENFLEEFKVISKQEAGQYYTPPSLVELILNEKLKVKNETNWNIKVLDPACGSGIFLVESFKRLVKRWRNANPGKRIEFKDLREIVRSNIYGIELDKYAIRVAAFSIYLAIIEQLNPKTLWINRSYKFPYLINDPEDELLENQGNNLFRADTIGEVNPSKLPSFDLIVGNPPFGTKIKLDSINKYIDKYGYGKDLVIPFLHKAIDFTNHGSIALIFNSKLLTNTEGSFQRFRKWLMNETYVEKIYNLSIFRKAPKSFGGQLFTSAVGPVSIVFYQKEIPKKISPTIEYWAPKTYVKNNLVEGVIIDATDIKFLPREECQKPDTKIWKIAMWGTIEDFKFINKLNEYSRLKSFLKEGKINKATGLQFLNKSTTKPLFDIEVSNLPYIQPEKIERYYTSKDKLDKLSEGLTEESILLYKKYYKVQFNEPLKKIDAFRRISKTAKKAFVGPHVLIKEGLTNKKLGASYIEESCSFNSTVLGINGAKKEILKSLTCYINSELATYYLFLISSSIGIERERVKPNELYELPFIFEKDSASHLEKYLDEIKKLIKKDFLKHVDISEIEVAVNEEIFKMFTLSGNERILISDFITYTMGMMFDGNNAVALKATNEDENFQYAEMLCKELNKFLGTTLSASANIYSVDKRQPLNMVKLTFNGVKNSVRKSGVEDFKQYLSDIDKSLLKQEATNIFIRRQIKYYDNNDIYIIKPNQKRFWCRSMAINDSKELISDILKMEYSE